VNRDPLYLWDASAMLALLLDERGAEQVEQTLERAAIHAVNFAEVVTKLVQKGVPPDQAREAEADLAIQVLEEFTLEQAQATGEFHAAARDRGLSLGDAVCLTMAKWTGMTAVTCNRKWAEVSRRNDTRVLCVR